MKTDIFKIVVSMLTMTLAVYGCTNNEYNGDVNIKNYNLSPCENSSKSSNADVSEHIKFSAINNTTIKVEQKFFISCCSEDIGIEMSSKENNITINIIDKYGDCNCICPRIITYEIDNLQENNTYEFVFLRNKQEYHTYKLLFTNQVEIEINL